MMKAAIVSLLLVAVVVVIAAPARPVISPNFHADVSVALREGDQGFRGGGIYSYDVKNNRARTDYRLEDEHNPEHYRYIHVLQRYDLHAVYTIEDTKCNKQTIDGQLENPWDFVPNTVYVGSGTFRGHKYDEWEWNDRNITTTRLAVLSSDTTTPLFVVEHETNNGVVTQVDTYFESFTPGEPEEWVFNVPHICNNTLTMRVGGDINSVVYFANNNWNCANVACSSRVAAGTGQPGYACAEFAARSLAAGGYLPGLSSTAAQSSYTNYKGHNLCLTTGLASALQGLGFKASGSVNSACALFGNAGEGSWSHACIGVGASTNDCHNNARYHISTTGVMYQGVNSILCP
jgi:hypothetical protein